MRVGTIYFLMFNDFKLLYSYTLKYMYFLSICTFKVYVLVMGGDTFTSMIKDSDRYVMQMGFKMQVQKTISPIKKSTQKHNP